MQLEIIQQIFDLFIPFSVSFSLALALMEYVFQFVLRVAFGRNNNKELI